MDDGTFGYVLSSFAFKVEANVGIHGCFAFCSALASRDALIEFGRLVRSVMDLMVLLFFCGCS